jgi:hypothetical protein
MRCTAQLADERDHGVTGSQPERDVDVDADGCENLRRALRGAGHAHCLCAVRCTRAGPAAVHGSTRHTSGLEHDAAHGGGG